MATSYLARVTSAPAGLEAIVVDGDTRMWLRAPAYDTVVVRDYAGRPYLRFARSGVWVNERSAMYYLNLTPPEDQPASASRRTAPEWHRVSAGHVYEWHDGRLQALAGTALLPGERYVGRWSIPIFVGGDATTISGTIWHTADPPIIWFWPIVVLLACVLAGCRLRRPALDNRIAQVLAVSALVALGVTGFSRELHGRPDVTTLQRVELVVIVAVLVWALARVVLSRVGYFAYMAIGFVATWEGLTLVPTLRHGFVLVELPAFAVRVATVVCLGAGTAVFLVSLRLAGGASHGRRARSRSS